MERHKRLGPLISRTILLSVGGIASFAMMVWLSSTDVRSTQAGPAANAVEEVQEVADPADQSDDPTRLDSEGRFTGPGEVWPPQPRGATDVVERPELALSVVAGDGALQRLESSSQGQLLQTEVMASDPGVSDALGERFNLIAVDQTETGADRLVYYSLSNNQTVDVVFDGEAVPQVELIAASEYQPVLSEAEKQAAVDLAKSYWQIKRDRRIDSLQGYSILAFQPNGSYYDTRMVYVSFHIDEDSRPELLAWVDLASESIIKSEVDR